MLGQLYRDGPRTPSQLAQGEGVQPQSLTRLLAELEADGLASREQDSRDRRQFLMRLTPAGRDAVRSEVGEMAAWLARAMVAVLSPTEQEMLRLAARLMDRLADAPAEAPGDAA